MKVVIIGNSAAGLAAHKAFRKYDKESEITIISKETGPAYSRVLIPYILRGKVDYDNIFIRDDNYYTDNNINFIEGEVIGINVEENSLELINSDKIEYDKLLIATGSHPVMPPIEGLDNEGVYNMWTKEDLEKLLPLFNRKKSMAVLGTGFVSLQAAWSARYKGLDVSIIARSMPKIVDVEGSKFLEEKIRETGSTLYTHTETEKVEKLEDGRLKIYLSGHDAIIVDFIIVGAGVKSNMKFIEGTGIIHEKAILVSKFMQTNIKGIYAAGDVAAGPTSFGDKHKTHALWPTAVEMGEVAGANMAGRLISYNGSLNMNVTQMFNSTVASMGIYNDNDADKSYLFDINQLKGYIKIFYKNDLIVGACLVGDSHSVKLLAQLRILIRRGIKIDCEPEKIESFLNIRMLKNRTF